MRIGTGMLIGILSLSMFYSSSLIHKYKVGEDKPVDSKTDKFVKEFSVPKLAEDQIAKRKQELAKREVEAVKEREDEQYIVSRGSSKSVPRTKTSMKSYMDYRKITNKSSAQYELQRSDDIYTDEEGFRKIGDNFIVAVGTYYSKSVGDHLAIELSNGNVFKAIVGDIKANRHTDSTNRQHAKDGSVIEFIVDVKKLDSLSKRMGDCSYAENANLVGNVISIVVLD